MNPFLVWKRLNIAVKFNIIKLIRWGMKKFGLAKKHSSFSLLLLALTCLSLAFEVYANPISLVGNRVETLINGPESRAVKLVNHIFAESNLSIEATTQAWSGAGLRSGKYIGYIDHYSLNNKKTNYIYSNPYLTLELHIASKSEDVASITRLDQVYRERVGIENRFANTDILRQERSVRWARSPEFFSNIQQLNDQRVDYILADKFMLDEVNKLLSASSKDPLIISNQPVVNVELSIGLNATNAESESLIQSFNRNLSSTDLDAILKSEQPNTQLDEALYIDIVRKW